MMSSGDNTNWLREVERRVKYGVLIVCEVCGKEFEAHSISARYCSPACRNDAIALRRMQQRTVKEKRG